MKIFYLGSSVTYGHFSNGISFVELLDYEYIKEAVSGTTLVDEKDNSYISRMKKVKVQPFDLFICQLSTNDATKKKELGTISTSFDMHDFNTLTINFLSISPKQEKGMISGVQIPSSGATRIFKRYGRNLL